MLDGSNLGGAHSTGMPAIFGASGRHAAGQARVHIMLYTRTRLPACGGSQRAQVTALLVRDHSYLSTS